MKISSFFDRFTNLAQVNRKADSEGNSSNQQQHQQKRDEKPQNEIEVTDEKIQNAITAFGADPQASAHGLTAAQTGQGAGLKVVLKDVSGGVVRTLTGEEFLRLRESTQKDTTPRGRILDQKL